MSSSFRSLKLFNKLFFFIETGWYLEDSLEGKFGKRISRRKTNAIHLTWACVILKSVTVCDGMHYVVCSHRVLCVALCMMYYEVGDLLLCRPPPLAHSSIISLCLSVTHKPGTLRSVSYQHDSFYPYQPFPFLIDFRVVMAMFFEIPVFLLTLYIVSCKFWVPL